jgi:hypothetical protein
MSRSLTSLVDAVSSRPVSIPAQTGRPRLSAPDVAGRATRDRTALAAVSPRRTMLSAVPAAQPGLNKTSCSPRIHPAQRPKSGIPRRSRSVIERYVAIINSAVGRRSVPLRNACSRPKAGNVPRGRKNLHDGVDSTGLSSYDWLESRSSLAREIGDPHDPKELAAIDDLQAPGEGGQGVGHARSQATTCQYLICGLPLQGFSHSHSVSSWPTPRHGCGVQSGPTTATGSSLWWRGLGHPAQPED